MHRLTPCRRQTKFESRLAGRSPPPLLGEHQKINAALALATVEILQNQIPVADEANPRGLGERELAGAAAIDSKAGRPENPARRRAQCGRRGSVLRAALEKHFPIARHATHFWRACRTKNGGTFAGFWRRWRREFSPCRSPASARPTRSELAAAFRAANPAAEIIACASLARGAEKPAKTSFCRHHRLALSGRRGAGTGSGFRRRRRRTRLERVDAAQNSHAIRLTQQC